MEQNKIKKISNLSYFIATYILLLITNLYCTHLIIYKLTYGWRFTNKILQIAYAQNTGAAFSVLQHSTSTLVVVSIIAVIVILYYLIKNISDTKKFEILLYSCFLAGISGNLYERLTLGYVRDFFNITFLNFPIFNISDILINIGVLGLIILLIFSKKSGKK